MFFEGSVKLFYFLCIKPTNKICAKVLKIHISNLVFLIAYKGRKTEFN